MRSSAAPAATSPIMPRTARCMAWCCARPMLMRVFASSMSGRPGGCPASRWCSPAPTPPSSATCRARALSPAPRSPFRPIRSSRATRSSTWVTRWRSWSPTRPTAPAMPPKRLRSSGMRCRMWSGPPRRSTRLRRWCGRNSAAISPSRPSSATPRRPPALLPRPRVRCRLRSSTSGSSPTISTPAASSPSTTATGSR